MLFRRSSAVTVALAAGSTLMATVIVAPPAHSVISVPYLLAPNTFSTIFINSGSTCWHRLRYGNVGNVAYAQLRMYAGECGKSKIFVRAQRGSTIYSFAPSSTTGGQDVCGRYFELQATSPANYIGVGASVDIGDDNLGPDVYMHDGAGGVRHGISC